MQPIAPLMIEHRLIERMIAQMQREWQRITDNMAVDREFAFVDPPFIDTAVDFLRTYADRCHHGKEEGLLFAALGQKDISLEHRELMEDLAREHIKARELVSELKRAKEDHLLGKEAALEEIIKYLGEIVEFYPRHIAKEDHEFFVLSMAYFSDAEKAEMLQAMHEFDRKMIHDKYEGIVSGLENRKGCQCHK